MLDVSDYARSRGKACPGCLVGVPSLGVVPVEFCLSIMSQMHPLNWNGATVFECNKPVAEARNAIVEKALKEGFEWVFFRDDDVYAPPDALNKLWNLRVPIASGVVWGKQWPTQPMMFKVGDIGGMRDWKIGDVVDADWCGMGCCLIHKDVFLKTEPPWFVTDPGSMKPNPYGGDPFTTGHTEDVYFCLKAKEAGYNVKVDTSVQCVHIDVNTGARYLWHPKFNTPCVNFPDGRIWVYPPAADRPRVEELNALPPPVNRPETVWLDLGAGAFKVPGSISVDLYEPADEKCDVRDLAPLEKKYGKVDIISSSHLLEHFRAEEVPALIRNWVDTLRPGGKLFIRVPDFGWACEQFLAASEDNPEKYGRKLQEIFGQEADGMNHKTGFTLELLMRLMKEYPLEGLEIEVHPEREPLDGFPGMYLRQQEIWVTGYKKKEAE